MNRLVQRILTAAGPLSTGILVLLLLVPAFGPAWAEFRDPLDWPAAELTRLAERPTQAVAVAGDTLVAVGARGLIATSSAGQQWQQSPSPVQGGRPAAVVRTCGGGW